MLVLVTIAISASTADPDPAPLRALNPLRPPTYDLAWTGMFLIAFVATPLGGLWLLWRLRGRTAA